MKKNNNEIILNGEYVSLREEFFKLVKEFEEYSVDFHVCSMCTKQKSILKFESLNKVSKLPICFCLDFRDVRIDDPLRNKILYCLTDISENTFEECVLKEKCTKNQKYGILKIKAYENEFKGPNFIDFCGDNECKIEKCDCSPKKACVLCPDDKVCRDCREPFCSNILEFSDRCADCFYAKINSIKPEDV